MDSIEEITIKEKVILYLKKYGIFALLIIAIFITVLLAFNGGTIEEKVKKQLDKYLEKNHLSPSNDKYYSFSSLGYELPSDCYEDGLVAIKNGIYKYYYVCNDENSKDLNELINYNQIKLNGPNPYILNVNEIYIEPGYISNDLVSVNSKVEQTPGIYLVNYNSSSGNSTRVVIITKKNVVSYPTLTLRGNKNVNLLLGEKYVEEGYIAYDIYDGDITKKVSATNNINIDSPGKYIITYKVTNSLGKEMTATRNVTVANKYQSLDIKYNISPNKLTNSDVAINLTIFGSGYQFLLDPDGNISENQNYTYYAKENGLYEFFFKKKDGTIETKEITIDFIDKEKPTGTCVNTILDGKSTIKVTASDNNNVAHYIYKFSGENEYTSELNTYSINKENTNSSVVIFDTAGNSQLISCFADNKTKEWGPTYTDSSYGGLKYLIYIPKGLKENQKNPLVIFLHGSGEFGNSISGMFNSNTAFVNNMKSGKFKNAIYLAPLCPVKDGEKNWSNCSSQLKNVIDYIVKTYNVDEKRISITGHSMGGNGVYIMISKYPNLFSAGASLAGFLGSSNASNLVGVPIKQYHGSNDTSVKYDDGKRAVNTINSKGGHAELITFQGTGHIIQSKTYDETDCIEWLISQVKK